MCRIVHMSRHQARATIRTRLRLLPRSVQATSSSALPRGYDPLSDPSRAEVPLPAGVCRNTLCNPSNTQPHRYTLHYCGAHTRNA